MSRARRILEFVAGSTKPVDFQSICEAVEPTARGRLRSHISAQLLQLVEARKLKRTGHERCYRYEKTPLTLVDRRRVTADGKPRDSSVQRTKARAAKRATRLVATAATTRSKPKPHQHMTIAPAPTPPTKAAPRPAERETVEQFLARGGQIQVLAHGESSLSNALDARTLNKRRKEYLGVIDPEPITD